jgi:hypothetical protein
MMFATTTYCRDADLTALRQRRFRSVAFALFMVTSVCMLGVQIASF